MKTLFVALAALLFTFFVGCQSSITDPADTDNSESSLTAYSENYASKDWISSLPGVIKIHDAVMLPAQYQNSRAKVDGYARYSVRKVYFDAPPPAPQAAFEVQLYIDATIITNLPDDSNARWTVQDRSKQLVYISTANQSIQFLEKTIRVHGNTGAPLNLVLKFQFDEKILELVSMRFKLVNTSVPIGDPAS